MENFTIIYNNDDNFEYKLLWNDEGYTLQTKKATYHLYEGMTIGGDKTYTSDILFIMDAEDLDRPARMVGFLYGASELDGTVFTKNFVKDIAETVKRYEERESKINSIVNALYDEENEDSLETMREKLYTVDGCHEYLEFCVNTINSILE